MQTAGVFAVCTAAYCYNNNSSSSSIIKIKPHIPLTLPNPNSQEQQIKTLRKNSDPKILSDSDGEGGMYSPRTLHVHKL